ncbi:MAG: hypothetical protein QM278_04975 [Pseudomonadota bacterium]|nr:hypothetical protein [Pseudomonadota bacterium]
MTVVDSTYNFRYFTYAGAPALVRRDEGRYSPGPLKEDKKYSRAALRKRLATTPPGPHGEQRRLHYGEHLQVATCAGIGWRIPPELGGAFPRNWVAE